MGLNIKNSDVEADIRKLAEMTGENLTSAVQGAVREKIARLESVGRPRTVEEFLAAIRPLQERIAAERAAHGDTRTSRELMEELYDEHGLPK